MRRVAKARMARDYADHQRDYGSCNPDLECQPQTVRHIRPALFQKGNG